MSTHPWCVMIYTSKCLKVGNLRPAIWLAQILLTMPRMLITSPFASSRSILSICSVQFEFQCSHGTWNTAAMNCTRVIDFFLILDYLCRCCWCSQTTHSAKKIWGWMKWQVLLVSFCLVKTSPFSRRFDGANIWFESRVWDVFSWQRKDSELIPPAY